jgi:hypothetical protein
MFCPSCGGENHDAEYCRSCGTDIMAVSQVMAGSLPMRLASRLDRYLHNKAEHFRRMAIIFGAGSGLMVALLIQELARGKYVHLMPLLQLAIFLLIPIKEYLAYRRSKGAVIPRLLSFALILDRPRKIISIFGSEGLSHKKGKYGDAVLYCPSCGSGNSRSVRYCGRCGRDLNVVLRALEVERPSMLVEALDDYICNTERRLENDRMSITLGGLLLIFVGIVLFAKAASFLAIASSLTFGVCLLVSGVCDSIAYRREDSLGSHTTSGSMAEIQTGRLGEPPPSVTESTTRLLGPNESGEERPYRSV